MRVRGRRHTGTARLLPDDDPLARPRAPPRFDSAAVRAFGAGPLTVRVDPDDRGEHVRAR